MPRLRIPELTEFERADLSGLPRQELEDLAWRFRELARTLANRLGEDSTTSSRPPSSDDPGVVQNLPFLGDTGAKSAGL